MRYRYKHIIVVHGIGDQAPNEAVLGFMNEFIRALPRDEPRYSIEVHNLIESVDEIGGTGSGAAGPPRPRRSFHPAFFLFDDNEEKIRHVINFSEVYWKQIPDEHIKRNDGNLPIPVFTWAHSINTRLLKGGRNFHIAREVIENAERMLALLGRLAALYRKSGQLAEITTKFLGDVQMYAESDRIRQEINHRFLSVLARTGVFLDETEHQLFKCGSRCADFREFEHREIFIVAHSEGTVIALDGLIQAAILSQGRSKYPEEEYSQLFDFEQELVNTHGEIARASVWLSRVKALVTLGSPIDKHYSIWPTRFRRCRLTSGTSEKIRWFNFWDHSDPVGYGLRILFPPVEEVRPDCAEGVTDAEKLFSLEYDAGFTRYFVPGIAHVGYWKDRAIYEYIIDHALKLGHAEGRTEVKSRWWGRLHPWADRIAYVLGRGVTLGAILFFLARVVAPVGGLWRALRAGSDSLTVSGEGCWFWLAIGDLLRGFGGVFDARKNLAASPPPLSHLEGWVALTLLIGPPLIIKALWEIYTRVSGGPAKIVSLGRKLLLVGWCVLVLIVMLDCAAASGQMTMKDWLGYLTGLVVSALCWSLHTTIHKGLIQMWHYTRGEGTGAFRERAEQVPGRERQASNR